MLLINKKIEKVLFWLHHGIRCYILFTRYSSNCEFHVRRIWASILFPRYYNYIDRFLYICTKGLKYEIYIPQKCFDLNQFSSHSNKSLCFWNYLNIWIYYRLKKKDAHEYGLWRCILLHPGSDQWYNIIFVYYLCVLKPRLTICPWFVCFFHRDMTNSHRDFTKVWQLLSGTKVLFAKSDKDR